MESRVRQRLTATRFERAASERNYGGLGLGLYVCRTVVEAMGGTIAVKSESGRGSTFTVELPPGVHEVVVTKKGYKKFKATVNLTQGQVQKVDVATMQKSSKVWIWVLIGVGAAVLVGGAIAIAASSGGGYYYY